MLKNRFANRGGILPTPSAGSSPSRVCRRIFGRQKCRLVARQNGSKLAVDPVIDEILKKIEGSGEGHAAMHINCTQFLMHNYPWLPVTV